VSDSCEHGNELSNSMKAQNFWINFATGSILKMTQLHGVS